MPRTDTRLLNSQPANYASMGHAEDLEAPQPAVLAEPQIEPAPHRESNGNGTVNGHLNGNGVKAMGTPAIETESGELAPPNTAMARLRRRLDGKVDPKACDWISVLACFLTGFTSSISFSACYVWPGFQTGNVAQLAISLARTFDPAGTRTSGFQIGDKQALTALTTFWLGTSLGRIGERIGPQRRIWLVSSAIVQVLFAMTAALLASYSGESPVAHDRSHPSWSSPMGMAALAFLSASLGLQGIVGKRIGSPMNTTVVLTATWVEIFNDASLFSLHHVQSRDVRVAGVLSVFVGAFISRALLGVIGQGGAVGILCALRLAQAVWWALIPGPKE